MVIRFGKIKKVVVVKVKIIEARHITDITERGEIIHYIRTFYRTEGGYEGHIDIRKEEYSEERLRKELEKEAGEVEKTLGKEIEI